VSLLSIGYIAAAVIVTAKTENSCSKYKKIQREKRQNL